MPQSARGGACVVAMDVGSAFGGRCFCDPGGMREDGLIGYVWCVAWFSAERPRPVIRWAFAVFLVDSPAGAVG